MERRAVATPQAPAAIGPYSQAIVAGELVFLSGQIALDPASGELVGQSAAEQTLQVMANLSAVLAQAGSSLDELVQVTIFLQDLQDFSEVNGVYAEHFSQDPPARATVEVARLPMDALVEIGGIAVRRGS